MIVIGFPLLCCSLSLTGFLSSSIKVHIRNKKDICMQNRANEEKRKWNL